MIQPRRNLSSLLSGNYDAVLAGIAGFVLIQVLAAHGGIGVSPDSVVYISTAGNIHDHGQINDFTNMPVMDFPAFYPLFLSSLLFLTGKSVVSFGPVLNGLLFALLIWLCGWMMERWPRPSRYYKWAILVFIVLSPCLLEVYSMIWSETIFILLSILFMIGCHRYFRTHTLGSLLLIGVIAGLACVTRYAGVSIVALGGLLMLCDGRLRWGGKKLAHMALYGLVSISFLALNLYRNYRLTETLTGYREKGVTSLAGNLYDFGSVFCDWLPFFNERYAAAKVVALIFLLLITGIFVFRLARRAGFFSYDTIAVSYFVVYAFFILFTATVSRFQQLDSRLLSPLFLPWLFGSTCWIPDALRSVKPRWKKAVAILPAVACFCFLLGEWHTWQENWEGIHYAGIPGYTEDLWKHSPTMNYVQQHKAELEKAGPIYSDANEGLWFLAGGLKSDLIAHKDNAEDIRYMLREDHFTMIWFDDAINDDLIDVDYLSARKSLVKELRFPDGVIYFFQTPPAAPAH
jgi:hypothetical protein